MDIYASMDPAKEVGGDFYNYFFIDDDHLGLIMADVSGKGVPAALFMMTSMIILTNNAMTGKTPAQILADTNAAICSHNREEMFVTVWLGILEISTGILTAANAGHEYPALNASPDGSPMQDLQNVRAAIDAFVQDAEQFDDLTMLCLTYRGPDKTEPSAAGEANEAASDIDLQKEA